MTKIGHWQGFIPPQYIYRNRQFKGIAVNPPDFNPGSWCGAGKAIYDDELEAFLITSRPRSAEGDKRGFAAEIYRSKDGVSDFKLVKSISKKDVTDLSGIEIHSIEGTQLLRDPLTNRWYFYISIDIGKDFVWGGLHWETLLLSADELEGPWKSEGVVLKNGDSYDAHQARDGTIDIIDGKWYCLYKAKDKNNDRRPAFAVSKDGIKWKKLGKLTIDGKEELAFLSGKLFPGATGLIFIGTEMIEQIDPKVAHVEADKHAVRHGSSMVNFCAYHVDLHNLNLDSIMRIPWEPLSPYEHKDHPLLGYSTSLYDPNANRILLYVEILDGEHTKKVGLNETVERVLVYQTNL
ncbi:MAG: hypothetical protein GF364_15960 [Candidatus Lokiarchaeota archaeon]|nr:hypothetical protein [Candidatus Lokiarchaeota archaeon]